MSDEAVAMPAICPNGHVYPSGVVFAGGGGATYSGSKSGPCPRCGLMGDIPDGTWTAETIRTLLRFSRGDLESLHSVVDTAKGRGTDEGLRAAQALPEEVRFVAEDALSNPVRCMLLSALLTVVLWMNPSAGAAIGAHVNHTVSEVVAQLFEIPPVG